MTITRIQGNARGQTTTSTLSVTLTSPPQNGNFLVAVIGTYASLPNVVSVSQTGVTWTPQIIHVPPGDVGQQGTNGVEIWLGAVGFGASRDIIITLDASIAGSIADVCEYSGLSGELDQTAVAGEYTGIDPTVTLTGTTPLTTIDEELVVGGVLLVPISVTQSQSSPTNGFVLLDGLPANYTSLAYLEKIVSSVGTFESGTTASGGSPSVYVGCIATFKGTTTAPPTVLLNVVAGNGGSVVPSGQFTLTEGMSYQFDAIPTTGYLFDHWELAGVNIGTATSLLLNATSSMNGQTLTALFATQPPPTIALIATASTGGSVQPSGQLSLIIGAVYQFTATASNGYHFDHWDLGGANIGISTSIMITVTSTMEGKTLTAMFAFTSPTDGTLAISAKAGTADIGASVSADGQSGITPVTFTFPAGTYTVMASYQGITLPAQTITITSGQTTQLLLQFTSTPIQAGFPIWILIPVGAVGVWFLLKGKNRKSS